MGVLGVAAGVRGVRAVWLANDVAEVWRGLASVLPGEAWVEEEAGGVCGAWADGLAAYLEGEAPLPDVPLDLRGTGFQREVWACLQQIPAGKTRTYGEVAGGVGRPAAVRAVASAVGRNPVAVLVPCHRVVRSGGGLGGFRWGVERKRALLEMEAVAPLRAPA